MRLRFSIFGNTYHFTFKFFGLMLFFVLLFSSLGVWQYHRAQEKRLLIQAHAERQSQQLIGYNRIFDKNQDARFYSVYLQGHFDNQHQLLLDNKTLDGQLGYEVYTPFLLEGSDKAILVDRGWVPANQDRHILPAIEPVQDLITIKGVLNTPPRYFSLGGMTERSNSPFPLRVQYINIPELTAILGLSLPPYIVWLDPADVHGFKRQWKVNLVGPEKHVMYTVQWFAFALSLLVIFVVLNLNRVKK
jgi:surfeit locus 1 family protein